MPRRAIFALIFRVFKAKICAPIKRSSKVLRAIAQQKGISTAQLAVAWVLSRGKDIIPLVGARRRDQLSEALGALNVSFSAEEFAAIEKAAPIGSVAGDRYGSEQMAVLDSERAHAEIFNRA